MFLALAPAYAEPLDIIDLMIIEDLQKPGIRRQQQEQLELQQEQIKLQQEQLDLQRQERSRQEIERIQKSVDDMFHF